MKTFIIYCLIIWATVLAPNSSLFAQESNFRWEQVAPGVWKSAAGVPETITPLSIAGITPRLDGLKKLGEKPFPNALAESVFRHTDGKTYLRFPLKKGEQLFGLGLNFKSVQQRGTIKMLHVDHYNGKDNGRTHAPVPFYVSSLGYGVLINSARYITVYAGTGVRADGKDVPPEKDRNTQRDWSAQPYSDAVEVLVPAAGTEVYVFAGTNPMDVVQRYNLYCGGGTLPPKWGLGFTHRTPTLFSDGKILQEVADFEMKGYPLSFVGLEPGWQSHSYPNSFVWDSTRFPKPKQFLDELLAKNIRANLWMNPYVSSHSPIFRDVLPFTASHMVWVGRVPDFTMAKARDLYQDLFTKQHLANGISGYKVDEVDGYDNWLWPDVTTFPSGINAEQMRQIYGLQFQKMTDGWFRQQNRRTYGLVRGSNAGASAMPYVIYNDYYDHRDFITALCSSSFIGVLWTPEARSSKTSEEWLRRMQTVCFSPMAMLNAWADGTKPWTFPDVAQEVKDVMLLRMQLLPYLYTTFAQYHFEGKPPIRAMQLVDGFTFNNEAVNGQLNSIDNPYAMATRKDLNDQFMVGDFLLVAPLFAGEKMRKVVLPAGKWYDFYTGKLAGEAEIIEITPGLAKIPLFVKEGGIIPMIAPVVHTPTKDQKLPLTVRLYGKKEAEWSLYDDDGETFDYENGTYTWTRLEVKRNKNGTLLGSWNPTKNTGFHYTTVDWVFMTP
ncbi:glycoside hydrolase family 31 protein [Spirosoma daeguense]